MAESGASAPSEKPEEPRKTCEKCRLQYSLDHFDHGVAGQECVCRRCLIVMGYRVQP